MSRHFGDFAHISNDVKNKIEQIENIFKIRNIDYDLYSGYPIINENLKKEFVKAFFITKYRIFVVYENEFEKVKFSSSLMNHLTVDSTLFKISSEFNKYVGTVDLVSLDLEYIEKSLNIELISDEEIKKINRAIQKSFNLTHTDDRKITNENSLGAIIQKRNTYISNYDEKQFNMVLGVVQKHQRIRGLAGSGKTILMLKKLAYLHYLDRQAKLCFVFFTTSLRSNMVKLFCDFYKEYEQYRNPDFNNIKIFHSWGSRERRGFYSDLCEITNKEYLNFKEAKNYDSNNTPFEVVSKKLLDELNDDLSYTGTYDYVFIDEAQDFGINFFHLVLKSLKPNGHMIYAYDELQSLREEISIPSKDKIFENKLDCEDINLSISYRAPLEILTTAHAIGMGIYRKTEGDENPIVNFVDENTLIDMGYENLTIEFKENHMVDLKRKSEFKSDVEVDEPKLFSSSTSQYTELVKDIMDLIENQDVVPEDIMIIDLDNMKLTLNHEEFSYYFEKELNERRLNNNYHIRLVSSRTPSMKKIPNAINYTSVFRAKGNEANLVFVINCNRITLNRNVTYRNEIFTAMTRAKVKVWLYGTNVEFLSDEINEVKNKDYHLKFIYPTEEQKKTIRFLGNNEGEIETKVEKAEELPIEILEAILAKKRAELSNE